MARRPNDALTGIQAPGYAVLYPTDYQITSAIRLLPMVMPGINIEKVEAFADTLLPGVVITFDADLEPLVGERLKNIQLAAAWLYQQSEMISRIALSDTGEPMLLVKNFAWALKEGQRLNIP